MDEIQYFTFPLPGLDEQYNQKIQTVSENINRRKAVSPNWVQALGNTPVRQLAVSSSHVAVLLEDGRLCRVGYSLNADQIESNKNDGKGGWSAKKPKKKSARMVSGIASSAERIPVPFRRNVTSAIAGLSGSSGGGSARTGREPGAAAAGRPSYSRLFMGSVPFIPPSQVPEDLIVQVQNVLQGKSRSLIIRELQRTNLDVNSAVNNLLSRDDDDGDDDEGGDIFADDLMSFVESNLTERGGSYIIDSDQMLVEDYINYAAAYRGGGAGSRQRLRGAVESFRVPGGSSSGGGGNADSDSREQDFGRRWLESRLRDPLTSQLAASSSAAPTTPLSGAAETTRNECQGWESPGGACAAASKPAAAAAPDAITWDEPEWCVMLPDTVCSPPPKFVEMASMHSELVALSNTGQVYQWKWNVSIPFTHPDIANVHHPRVVHLGLQNEVVVKVAASALRCTVLTEGGQVATWMDPSIASYCSKLEHHAFSLDHTTDSIAAVHVCDLFTVASTCNNCLYWWGVAPFSQRRKLLEKLATKTSKSGSGGGGRGGSSQANQQCAIIEGCTVTKKKSPMYHAGAIGFCDFTFPPKVGQLMEDIWNLDAPCRFKVLPLEKKRDDSKKTEMLPPPSPVSVGSEGSHKSQSRKRRKSVSPHPFAQEEEYEEVWNPRHVVFLEDSKNIPIGTVLKVDGNIAAVKFMTDKSSGGQSSAEDDTQSFLKDCRLFQKSDLQALKPNAQPKFMDCIQRVPKRIGMSDKYHTIAFDVDNRGVHILSSCVQSKMYYIVLEPSTGRVEERRVFYTNLNAFLGSSQSARLLVAQEEPAKLLLDGNGALYPICKDDAGQMREPFALNLLPIKTAAVGTHYLREGVPTTQRVLLSLFITKSSPTMSAVLQCNIPALNQQLALLDSSPDVAGPKIVAERCDGNRNIMHALVYLSRPTSNDSSSSSSSSSSDKPPEEPIPALNAPPPSSTPISFNDVLSYALSSTQRQTNFEPVPTLTWPPEPPAYETVPLSDSTDARRASAATDAPPPPQSGGSSNASRSMSPPLDLTPPSNDSDRQKAAVKMLATILAGATKPVVPVVPSDTGEQGFIRMASWKPHLISLLSLRDGTGMTPFMLSVNLRSYQVAMLIFAACKRLATTDENGEIDNEVLMRMVFPASCVKEEPELSPLYMLCCNDHCSFTWTGDLHINQDIFECRTCGLHDTYCCCTECARTCHRGHDCKLKKTWPTAYCDCWRRGRCCALIEGDQPSRFKLLCQLLEHTDLATLRNRRGEHLLLFLVNTMSRQILEQSGLSKSGGGGGGGVSGQKPGGGPSSRNENDNAEGMPDHSLDPPKFCRRAMFQVVQNWKAVSSMMYSPGHVQQTPDLPDLTSFQLAYLKSQTGSAKLDAFTYKLIVKCKTENVHLEKLLETLGSRLTGAMRTPEAVNVVRRFVRSVCRVFVILSMETQHSKNKTSIASEPLRRCKKVFKSLLPVSIEELSETADSLIAPVRMGIARPTRPFSSLSSTEDKQGSAELFSTEPLPPRRSVAFEEVVAHNAGGSSSQPRFSRVTPVMVSASEGNEDGADSANPGQSASAVEVMHDEEGEFSERADHRTAPDSDPTSNDGFPEDEMAEDDMDDGGPGSSAEGGMVEDDVDVQFDVDMIEESDTDSDRSEAQSPALDTTNATIGSDIFMSGGGASNLNSNLNVGGGVMSDGEESHSSSQDDDSEGSPSCVIEDLFPQSDAAAAADSTTVAPVSVSAANRNVPQSIQWAVGGQPTASAVASSSRPASSFSTSSPMSGGGGSNMIYVDPSNLRRSTITSAAAAAVASSSLAAAAAAANMAEPCSSAATNISLARAFSVVIRTLSDLVLAASDTQSNTCGPSVGSAAGAQPLTQAQFVSLRNYVDRRLELTWEWLMSVMDSTEAQLRFGSALISNTDLTHPTHPLHPSQRRTPQPGGGGGGSSINDNSTVQHSRRNFESTTRNPGRAAQQDSSAARRDFLNYLLSLMRSHNNEHSDALPVIDISAFKHVAYVLDAMVFYLKYGRDASDAAALEVDEVVDYGELLPAAASNANVTIAAAAASTAAEDENDYDSLDESYNAATAADSNFGLSAPGSKRGFSFFRRTASTLCLGSSSPSPFDVPLVEALPLAERPTLLTPHATKEELFGRPKLVVGLPDTSCSSSNTLTLDRMDIEILPMRLALTDRVTSEFDDEANSNAEPMPLYSSVANDNPAGASEYTSALDMSSSTLNASAAAAAAAAVSYEDGGGAMCAEFGGDCHNLYQASTSTPARNEEGPAGCSRAVAAAGRQGRLSQVKFSRDMLLGRWSHCLELFGRVFMEDVGAQPGSLLSEISTFDVREARFKKEMEKIRNSQTRDLTLDVERERNSLITWTMKQLNSQYNKRSSFPGQPMAVHKVKVTFTNEPGEGTGVSRSFYTAIAEALLSDEKLPPGLPAALSATSRIPIRKIRGASSANSPSTPAGGAGGRQSPNSHNRSSKSTGGGQPPSSTASGLNLSAPPYDPPQDDTQTNSLGAILYANALSLHPAHAAKITGMLMELDIKDLVEIKNNPDKFREKVDQALALILGNKQPDAAAPEDDQCAPLFYQPGKPGHFSPRLGKCTPERLEVFRNVGRLLGLCLLQNELIPIPLSRHVLKYILNRDISWHDFAFFDPVMYESMRKLVVDASADDAAEMFRDLGLTYSVVLRTEEGGGEVSLVPMGADIQVTPDNVVDFVRRYCEYRMKVACEKPLKAIKRGVYEVIPSAALSDLTAEDLRLLLNGTVTIDPKQLLGFTTFNDESGEDNPDRIRKFKKNFWSIVEKMNQKELQDLVYFWTGSPGVPASEEGFQPMPSITMRPADDNYFPTANTCISRLYIPLYSSKAQLKSKVLQAIQVKSFGFV